MPDWSRSNPRSTQVFWRWRGRRTPMERCRRDRRNSSRWGSRWRETANPACNGTLNRQPRPANLAILSWRHKTIVKDLVDRRRGRQLESFLDERNSALHPGNIEGPQTVFLHILGPNIFVEHPIRSEERRVGKACR